MRVNLILIVLALVLLGAGMLCVLGLNRSAQALLQEAEAAAEALPGDAEAARAHLDAFAARWARTERAWQFIAIHEDIEEITAALREAREEIGLALDPTDLHPGGSYRQQYSRGEGNGFDDELAFAFLTRMDGVPPFRPGSEVADMAFVSLADFAAAHENTRDLPARRMDGSALTIPHSSLCCLHQSEWEGVRGTLEQLLA